MAAIETTLAAALEAFRHGDSKAEELLLEHCHAWLRVLAAKKIMPRYPEVARWDRPSDLVQDATLRLCFALREKPPESERHLLNLAALKLRQVVVDRLRHYRAGRNPLAHAGTNVVADDGRLRVEEAEDVLTGPMTYDRWTTFFQAVDALPELQREIFQMTWFLGADQATIARAPSCGLRPRIAGGRWCRSISKPACSRPTHWPIMQPSRPAGVTRPALSRRECGPGDRA